MTDHNPKITRKLIDALRSGAYPQGKGMLRSADGYCCQGVLCDIVESSEWIAPNDRPDVPNEVHAEIDNSWIWPSENDRGLASYYELTAPGSVLSLAGISDELASVLVNLNDGFDARPTVTADDENKPMWDLYDRVKLREALPHTFGEIADIIEAEVFGQTA